MTAHAVILLALGCLFATGLALAACIAASRADDRAPEPPRPEPRP